MRKNIVDIIRRFTSNIYSVGDAKQIIDASEEKNTLDIFESDMDKEWLQMMESNDYELSSNMREAYSIIKQTEEKEKLNRFKISNFIKYAVACIFAIGLSVFSYQILTNQTSSNTEVYSELTATGERKLITLPDGSQVHMNASTTIEYSEDNKLATRNLIVQGEVFLDVAKNPEKPFIVKTPTSTITVLGTSFNVKAYKEDDIMTVSVQSGKVNVEINKGSAQLTTDEQLVLEHDTGMFVKRQEDSHRVKSWIDGNLYFNKTPLKQVIRELERIYQCEIELQDNYDDFIYGEHENQSIEEVLKSLEYTTGLKHMRKNNRIILYK